MAVKIEKMETFYGDLLNQRNGIPQDDLSNKLLEYLKEKKEPMIALLQIAGLSALMKDWHDFDHGYNYLYNCFELTEYQTACLSILNKTAKKDVKFVITIGKEISNFQEITEISTIEYTTTTDAIKCDLFPAWLDLFASIFRNDVKTTTKKGEVKFKFSFCKEQTEEEEERIKAEEERIKAEEERIKSKQGEEQEDEHVIKHEDLFHKSSQRKRNDSLRTILDYLQQALDEDENEDEDEDEDESVAELEAFLVLEGLVRLRSKMGLKQEEIKHPFYSRLVVWRNNFKFFETFSKAFHTFKKVKRIQLYRELKLPMFLDKYTPQKISQNTLTEQDWDTQVFSSESCLFHVAHNKEAHKIKENGFVLHAAHNEEAHKIKESPSDNKNALKGVWFHWNGEENLGGSVYGNNCFTTTLGELGITGLENGEIIGYKQELHQILYPTKGENLHVKIPTEEAANRILKGSRGVYPAYVNVSVFVPEGYLPKTFEEFRMSVRGPDTVTHDTFCVREKRGGECNSVDWSPPSPL